MRTGKSLILFVTSTLLISSSPLIYGHTANVDSVIDKSINNAAPETPINKATTTQSNAPVDTSKAGESNVIPPTIENKSDAPSATAVNTSNAAQPTTENASNTKAPTAADIIDAKDPNAAENTSDTTSSPVVPIVTSPATDKDIAVLEKLVKDWTAAFNKKDLNATCSLFSKHIIADYRGLPQKNHAAICDGFKKIFADKLQRYEYKYKIHNIYRLGDLAAIRITWYLHVFQGDKEIATIQDEGMDVLMKNDKDQWQIINYLAYQK